MGIKRMDLSEQRESFVMYTPQLEQAYDYYDMCKTEGNYKKGMEFCIAMMETMLTGETSSDDKSVQMILRNSAKVAKSNIEKYNIKKESARYGAHYDEVAKLYNQGLTQDQIANKLQISQGRVSQIYGEIRVKHPELLDRQMKY